MDIQAGKGGQRPRMLMCYLCGREFGTKSLPIHLPQCQKRWETTEMAKHPKDRRPIPQPPAPEIPIKSGFGGAQAIDDFNEAAYEQFRKTLESCQFCQRKFKPEAYKHHQRACSASKPAKPVGTGLISNSLSNNERLKAYTLNSRSGKHSRPAVVPNKHNQSMKQTIVDARAQRPKGWGGVGVGSCALINVAESTTESNDKVFMIHTLSCLSWVCGLDPVQGQSSKGGQSFCQECGADYGGSTAKFCGACGTKRPPPP